MHQDEVKVIRERLEASGRLAASAYELARALKIESARDEFWRREMAFALRGLTSIVADLAAHLETLRRPVVLAACPHCGWSVNDSSGRCLRCRGVREPADEHPLRLAKTAGHVRGR